MVKKVKDFGDWERIDLEFIDDELISAEIDGKPTDIFGEVKKENIDEEK